MAALATAAAAVELAAGRLTGSAALLAEGLHMGAHVSAFVVAGLAYVAARRFAATSRLQAARAAPDVAALLNGLLLLGLGGGLALESAAALIAPAPISYGTAIGVAVFGLTVRGEACVTWLKVAVARAASPVSRSSLSADLTRRERSLG